jgi:hypothetical protein
VPWDTGDPASLPLARGGGDSWLRTPAFITQGHFAEAMEQTQQLLAIHVKAGGPASVDSLADLRQLSVLLQKQCMCMPTPGIVAQGL